MFRRYLIPALALFAALAAVEPASAQRGRDRGDVDFQSPSTQWNRNDDPQEQREVQLSSILRELQQRYGGRHVGADRNGDRWVISWVTQDGRKLTVEADARSGRIISTRGG